MLYTVILCELVLCCIVLSIRVMDLHKFVFTFSTQKTTELKILVSKDIWEIARQQKSISKNSKISAYQFKECYQKYLKS